MSITVRPARLEEAALVREIMVAAFTEYDERLGLESSALEESVDDVCRHLLQGGAVLAFEGEIAAGSGRWERREGFAYLGRLSVLPSHRRRGIAGLMIDSLEDQIRAAGIREVRLEVRMSLPENLALYESHGYVLRNVYPHYRDPEHEVGLMVKLL
jgi:ribosomal protein S18 acetylase RimI-like enzyme